MEGFEEQMNAYIKEQGGRVNASKQSLTVMEDMKKAGEMVGFNGRLEKGMMYTFRYFTPTEPMYDTWPMVIGLGMSDNGHQLGINLHYIPYLDRVQFVKEFLISYQGSIHEQTIGKKANNAVMQGPLDMVDYKQIKAAFGRKYNITYAVRQYTMKRMREPYRISYENWHVAVSNDENYFMGTNINEAQANYLKT